MRVTNRMQIRNYVRYTNNTQSNLQNIQDQIASGNKQEAISTDVASGLAAMRARAAQYKSDKANAIVDQAVTRLGDAEDSLQLIDDLLKEVNYDTLRLLNDPSKTARDIYATKIRTIRDEIFQQLNTKTNGVYQFSGSNNYQPGPFSLSPDGEKMLYNYNVDLNDVSKTTDGRYVMDEYRAFTVPQGVTYRLTSFQEDGFRHATFNNVIYKADDGNYYFETAKNPINMANPSSDARIYDEFLLSKIEDVPGGGGLAKLKEDMIVRGNGDSIGFATRDLEVPEGVSLYYSDSTLGEHKNITASQKFYKANDGAFYVYDTKNPPQQQGDGTYPPGDDKAKLKDGNLVAILKQDTTIGTDKVYSIDGDMYLPGTMGVPTFKISSVEIPLNDDIYIDADLDLKFTSMVVDPRSAAYNTFNGAEIAGFGFDVEKGYANPNNLYNLLSDLANYAEEDNFSRERVDSYLGTLQKRMDSFRVNITDIGTRVNHLETIQTRLEKKVDVLEEEMADLTGADYIELSTEQVTAQTALRALYLLGSNIIPLSLSDFLR